eukprot:scaffold33175_cov63-Phaeocystis_antarctica.AAC.1
MAAGGGGGGAPVVRYARGGAHLEHLSGLGQRGEGGVQLGGAPGEAALGADGEHLVGVERDQVGREGRVQPHHGAHHVRTVLSEVALAPPHVAACRAEASEHAPRERVVAAVVEDDDLVGREPLPVVVDHVRQVLALIALEEEDTSVPVDRLTD